VVKESEKYGIGMELGSGLGDGISSVQDCEVVPSSDLV